MLPEGWYSSTLGEIARITSGGTPDRSEASYWGGDVPWVTTGEIQFNTITDAAEKITVAGLKNSSAKLFPPGTLLMAMYGQGKTRGQVAKLGIEAATNQACAAILFHDGYDADFYFHFLASHYEAIRELGNAGTQQNLSGGILKGVTVPVAPLDEQRRIACILASWDVAISAADRLRIGLERQRSIVVSELISGRKRFASSTDWTSMPIGSLIRESRKSGSGGHEARKLTVKLYGKGVIAKTDKRPGSEATRYYQRSSGQLIYSKLDFLNGAFGIIPQALDGYESTLDLPTFDFLPGVDPQWFLHFVSREEFYQGQLGLANGGRKARRVNPDDLLRVRIDVPPLEEQRAIANVIGTADSQITTARRQVELLKQEKAALMADLLTGKRRVRLSATEVIA